MKRFWKYVRSFFSRSKEALPFRVEAAFDREYYLRVNEDVRQSGADPWHHFLEHGWKEGRNPRPEFDVSWYLDCNSDVAESGVNPFEHFVLYGWKEGRHPAPGLRINDRILNRADLSGDGEVNPFVHLTSSAEIIFDDLDDQRFVSMAYLSLIGRRIDPSGLQFWGQKLAEGLSRGKLLELLMSSEEAISRTDPPALKSLSNVEFIDSIWEMLLGRACDPEMRNYWLGNLERDNRRMDFVAKIIGSGEFLNRLLQETRNPEMEAAQRKNRCWIMGTERFLAEAEWTAKLANVALGRLLGRPSQEPAEQADSAEDSLSNFKHLQHYLTHEGKSHLVSIITSLYKGGDYIETFLENLTSQLGFREFCELIIIDANSPENERETIESFQESFPNILYTRTEETIPIYETWNRCIDQANGAFITNANLDDLRRSDCIARQADTLLAMPETDVVFQDFYYSFTPNLPFDIVATCGYRSQAPLVTRANLLKVNSPHNAPMWRKELHSRVGTFDSRFRSAGDWEFWLRCLLHDTRFFKIEEPLVVYYNNPSGLSTAADGPAPGEANEIQRLYTRLLGASPYSLKIEEFREFCRMLFDLDPGDLPEPEDELDALDRETFLYRCFENKLQREADTRKFVTLNLDPS